MKPEAKFFKSPGDFRAWFEKHHDSETELIVGFWKVDSGKPSITWSESVDHALCFGWIDGIRRSIDDKSYSIRFTPRKPNSIWSAINIKKIEVLRAAGLMKPEGEKAFSLLSEKRNKVYLHEKGPVALEVAYELQFRKNKIAWDYFSEQAPSYKKVMFHWIMSAKQEATRLSRLQKTIEISSEKKRMR